MDSTDETISRTVKAYLAFRKIPPADFCTHMGMTRSTYYSRMAGETGWSADEVARMADFLGIDVSTLYAGIAA